MFDEMKTYFAEVIARKVVPAAIASGIAAVMTFLLAHTEILQKYGITVWNNFAGIFPPGQAPTGDILIVEFDTLKKGTAALAIMGVTAFMAWLTHHSVATVTGAPQSGDKRVEEPTPLVGGERKDDPPKGELK